MNIKTVIIAIAKNENLYINEWINYHLNIGFDNIIICDNDNTLILKDIINDKRVIIEDYTNIKGVQLLAYKNTFNKYKNIFDWFLFIDIDEFLYLENHNNVKDFILSFDKNVECIKLCWKHFGDNELLDVIDNNYNVVNRFTTAIKSNNDFFTKYFVKNSINNSNNFNVHTINDNNIYFCDALGNKCDNGKMLPNVIHKNAWINHYKTKTIGEFIRQKYFRGGPNHNDVKYHRLYYFFELNTKNQEKIDYANKLINELKNDI